MSPKHLKSLKSDKFRAADVTNKRGAHSPKVNNVLRVVIYQVESALSGGVSIPYSIPSAPGKKDDTSRYITHSL
jgi:hypothetical protein